MNKTNVKIWEGIVYLGEHRNYRLTTREPDAHPYPLNLIAERLEQDSMGEKCWITVDDAFERAWVMGFFILESVKKGYIEV